MTPKPSLIVKPRIEFVIAEKHSSGLCNREEMHMERFGPGSFVSYSSFHAVERSFSKIITKAEHQQLSCSGSLCL